MRFNVGWPRAQLQVPSSAARWQALKMSQYDPIRKDRKTCKKCSGRHPTMLHEDRTVTPTATTGHLSPSKTGGAKLQILKVRVGLGSKKVTTNAFLDSGSTHSFITGHLLDKMKMMPQKKMPLKVSTIRGEEAMDSSLVPGLLIESLDGDNNMELPPLYVLDYIPVKAEDVPSQEDMKTWSYLQDAGVYLETLKDDEEIGLLIGGNAAGVMEPGVMESARAKMVVPTRSGQGSVGCWEKPKSRTGQSASTVSVCALVPKTGSRTKQTGGKDCQSRISSGAP